MVKGRVCDLPFQWSGEKEKITLRTAISAFFIWFGFIAYQPL